MGFSLGVVVVMDAPVWFLFSSFC